MIVCPSRAAAPVPSMTRTFVSTRTLVSTVTYDRVAGPTGARCATSGAATTSAAAAHREMICFMT